MNYEFKQLEMPGVVLITLRVYPDERGYFMEAYKESVFRANGINYDFKQDNHSLSKKGVFRGLHYQKEPMAQGKLVRVIKGAIIDYAVDIRKGSQTYGNHVAVELNEDKKQLLWIPPGFAHGFLSLRDGTEVHYKTTNEYSPEHESGIRWDDPDIGLKIPLPRGDLIIAEKDKKWPKLKDAETNFES